MKIWLKRDKIDHYIHHNRLSQSKFADEAGINLDTFRMQYYHKGQASLKIVLLLAMLMECDIEELLDVDWGTDHESKKT